MPSEHASAFPNIETKRASANWWNKTPLWAKCVIAPLAAGFAGSAALLGLLKITPLPDPSLASPTLLESSDGSSLAEWTTHGSRPQTVPLKQIPVALQNATLAVEDADFYHHFAFDPKSELRALLVDLRERRMAQGGSTITQQLARNLFLSQDRTLTRKVRELLYAIQLELHESKSTILEQYLNVVYYGHGAYGAPAAAELYFNKPVESLTLPECALLAGLPRGPAFYSPLDNFAAAKARQRIVLNRMVATGYLTQAQADEAYRTALHISRAHPPMLKAPYFTQVALAETKRRFHVSSEALYQGNIHIKTTLDPLLQQAAQRAVATTLRDRPNLEAALVALNPETGAILAMVGGRDYATSPYNRVFAERQPGSAFKPFVYATALESGWTPARQVNSELTTFAYDKGKRYTVHDFGDMYAHRPLTLREALARSDNVYAVTANLQVGPHAVVQKARDLGVTSSLAPYPSLALGVFPTSPLTMATAYAAFANGGYRVTPYTVSEVEQSNQDELYQTAPSLKRVLSPQLAYQMTDLLTSVLEPHGTGYSVHNYLHALAAAKTGTTDTDGWMVGYTPKVVCATWVGYDDNHLLTSADAHMASIIWAKFIGTAQQRLPSDWFKVPDGLVKRTIDPVTGELATPACRDVETDYFLPGSEPTAQCKLHPATLPPDGKPKSGLFQWLRHWLS